METTAFLKIIMRYNANKKIENICFKKTVI